MRYFDWNASTPLLPQVAELIARGAGELTGNPSSVHQAGRASRARLQAARDSVARVLGCEPREVAFTGCGSEGAALAIKGAFAARTVPTRRRIVTSLIEHPCVLGSVEQLQAEGAEVIRLRPDSNGRITEAQVLEVLTDATAVCSLMWANNETGVLQPVAEVARACQRLGIVFHTDAVQVVGKLPVSLREVPACLSISAHKFGGPQGVGALISRRTVNLQPLVPGHQEDGRRGGTQAVMMAEALALALETSAAGSQLESERLGALRSRFETALQAQLPGVNLNGGGAPRIPNTANVRFDGADGEALLIALDLEGFSVSSGAACASGSLKPSHVLTAMGLTPAQAQGSLRFSMGRLTTQADVEALTEAVVRHVPAARAAAR